MRQTKLFFAVVPIKARVKVPICALICIAWKIIDVICEGNVTILQKQCSWVRISPQ